MQKGKGGAAGGGGGGGKLLLSTLLDAKDELEEVGVKRGGGGGKWGAVRWAGGMGAAPIPQGWGDGELNQS